MRSTADELKILESQNVSWLQGLLDKIVILELQGASQAQKAQALDDLARAIAKANETADLMGRRRLALEINNATGRRDYAVPVVPFEEAIEDILKRHPAIAPGWEATRDYYLDGGFAIARSSKVEVTQRAQGAIRDAMRGGLTGQEAIDKILRAVQSQATGDPSEDWTFTGSYAETVYRTNIASSYTAGRIEQAKDPVFKREVAAWEVRTYPGPDVRPNHAAMRGKIAATDDPIWETMKPPLGYNCRCSIEFVGHKQALKAGAITSSGTVKSQSIPSGAFPDPGFKGAAT